MSHPSSPHSSGDEIVYVLTPLGRAEYLRMQGRVERLSSSGNIVQDNLIGRTNEEMAREAQMVQALALFQATTINPDFNIFHGLPAAAPLPQAQPAAAAHQSFTTTSNGRRRVAGWNVDLRNATSASVRLPQCDIGAVELATFFPNHTQWPAVVLRLIASGWNARDITDVQLHAHGAISAQARTRRNNAIRHQIIDGGNQHFRVHNFTQTVFQNRITALARPNGVATYDASTYAPRGANTSIANLTTASLLDVAQGVVNWPAPEDRGLVTRVIELAIDNNWPEITVDDIPQIGQFFGFTVPAEAGRSEWDERARERVLAAVAQAGPYP